MPLHPLRPPPFSETTQETLPAADVSKRACAPGPKSLASRGEWPTAAMASPHRTPRGHPLEKVAAYRRARSNEESSPWGRAVYSIATDRTAPAALTVQLPKEMRAYILELEEQNQQLRQHILEMQESLEQAKCAPHTQNGSRNSANKDAATTLPLSSAPDSEQSFATQEERESYMNDVIAQVDAIVQVHRNQSEADILKYKQQADLAQEALRQLREAVALEGVDLDMLPIAMSALTSRADNTQPHVTTDTDIDNDARDLAALPPADAPAEPMEQLLLSKCAPLVDAAANAVLSDLLRVEASDDVPSLVRCSLRRGFSSLARHVAAVSAAHLAHSARALRQQHAEGDRLRGELRAAAAAAEAERRRLAQRHETALRTLRDERRAMCRAAAAGDERRAVCLERALDECGAALTAARDEALALRRELEEERSASAATCLRLKASLQRRCAEFEAAVTKRAGEVAAEADRRRAEAEAEAEAVRRSNEARARGRASRGTQAEMEEPLRIDEPHYMANVLSLLAAGEQSRGVAGLNQSFGFSNDFASTTLAGRAQEKATAEEKRRRQGLFEKDVWEKTIELVNKYGGTAAD